MAIRTVKAGPFCEHGISVSFPCRRCGKRPRVESFKWEVTFFLVILAALIVAAILETRG